MSEPEKDLPVAGRDDGVTIVELLIALTVVMITFAALASTIIASFSAIRANEDRVTATALANEAIEDMTTMPWAQLGLSENDASLASAPDPIDPDGEPVFEGEQVVILQEDLDDGVPRYFDDTATAARDGRQYEITRVVTFIEEEDGADLKRMIVIVTWDDGNRSIRTEGVRAPDPSDLIDLQIISMDIVSSDPASDSEKILLREPGDDSEFSNDKAFTVTVVVGDADASLSLSFRDRGGTLRVITTADTDDTATREFPIAVGEYEFPHGPVPFLATAVGTDGQIASDTQTARFYQPLNVQGPDVQPDGLVVQQDGLADPNTIVLDGTTCQPTDRVRVQALVWGMTANEAGAEGALEATWTLNGVTEPDPPRPLGQIEQRREGGLYAADVYNESVNDPNVDLEPTFFQGNYTFWVDADRQVVDEDGAVLADPYTDEVNASVGVDVQAPVGLCSP